jgi:hypothetical protein
MERDYNNDEVVKDGQVLHVRLHMMDDFQRAAARRNLQPLPSLNDLLPPSRALASRRSIARLDRMARQTSAPPRLLCQMPHRRGVAK